MGGGFRDSSSIPRPWTEAAWRGRGHRVRPDNKGHLILLGALGTPYPNASAAALRPLGGGDVFLAKYALDGTVRWARHYGGPNKSWVTPGDMDIDPQDNVIVFGDVDPPPIDLGTGVLTPTAASQSVVPPIFPFGIRRPEPRKKGIAFLAKYDSNGAPLWSRLLAIEGSLVRKTVAIDSLGNLWLAGHSPFEIEMDGVPVSRSGEQLGYLIKLDARGKHKWSTRLGEREFGAGLRLAAAVPAPCTSSRPTPSTTTDWSN